MREFITNFIGIANCLLLLEAIVGFGVLLWIAVRHFLGKE